jgi:chromate transporter
MISPSRLTWLVLRDVNRTLGGGLASMELLRRTFIAEGLIDEAGNAGLVAVSRLTPGTNVLAYCVGLGWLQRRWTGALAALLASSVPASILVGLLALALVQLDQYRSVRVVLALGLLVATVLVFSSAWYLLRPYLSRAALARTGVVVILSGGLLLAGVTPVRILLWSAALGAAIGTSRGFSQAS